LYVHASAESLPEELNGLVSHISILLPWGSLLKAAAGQEINILKNIAKLCREQATIHVIFGYEVSREQKMIEELGLPQLTSEYLEEHLPKTYLKAGFSVKARFIKKEELKAIDSTWAKKLAYGRNRQYVEIKGVVR
jgi:16S rRNA (adenine(1408)-N(1))-methyltransferase